MKNLIASALVLVSVTAAAAQHGGGAGAGFGGAFGRNNQIVTADQGIRNAQIRQDKENASEEAAAQKATQHSINGKCDDEQSAWKIIAPTKTKHKNYDEAVELYNKAVDSFNTERNRRTANAQCEQLLTKALDLLK